MTEWISTSEIDRLPEPLPDVNYSRDVLFYARDERMFVGCYNKKENYWNENNLSCGCCWEPPIVLFWCELPEPPK